MLRLISQAESSKVLVAASNFLFKLWYFSCHYLRAQISDLIFLYLLSTSNSLSKVNVKNALQRKDLISIEMNRVDESILA